MLLSSRPGTWTLKFNVTLHQCVTDGSQVASWRNKETGGDLVGGQELNSFHANVFQPVSSNQYSHRPRDKIHPHHFLRIITQRTSEFTREARGSNERCLPERRASSREKTWTETEISQFNDTKVLFFNQHKWATNFNYTYLVLWYRDLLRLQSKMNSSRTRKVPSLQTLKLLFQPTATVSSASQGFPRSLR